MAQYIDKDALIAEIDKRLSTFRESFIANMEAPITIIGVQGMWTYTALKDIIDTLEVKELADSTKTCKDDRQKPQRIISAEAKEAMYGKPAWSEEDEKNLNATLAFVETIEDLNNAKDGFRDIKLWIKSIKERMKGE